MKGLEVTIIAPANPADPIKLVARERVHFSLTYVPEVMLARETGIPVVAVAASMRILGSGLFYLADSGIASPKDLKGMTLGVGPKQDAQAFLATLLGSEGLTKADVKGRRPRLRPRADDSREQKVQASHGLVFGEGVVADEILVGDGKEPVKWLLYRDYGVPNFYYQLFVGNEDWVRENDNATCRFLRATAKGTDEWLANPDATLAAISEGNTAFTPKQHRGIYDATTGHWKEADGTIFVQEAVGVAAGPGLGDGAGPHLRAVRAVHLLHQRLSARIDRPELDGPERTSPQEAGRSAVAGTAPLRRDRGAFVPRSSRSVRETIRHQGEETPSHAGT